jgi:hypothetical protein
LAPVSGGCAIRDVQEVLFASLVQQRAINDQG